MLRYNSIIFKTCKLFKWNKNDVQIVHLPDSPQNKVFKLSLHQGYIFFVSKIAIGDEINMVATVCNMLYTLSSCAWKANLSFDPISLM